MGKPVQGSLTLLAGLQRTSASAVSRLMNAIRDVDLHDCPKREVMVEELGIKSASHLSEVLDQKHDKHFPLAWLPAFVRHDDRHLITTEIAGWSGLRVLPVKLMSAREKVARYERVLERLGSAGDAIRRDALELPDDEFAEEQEP